MISAKEQWHSFHIGSIYKEKTTLGNAIFSITNGDLSVMWKVYKDEKEYCIFDNCKGKVALIYWDLINQL